MAGQAVTSGSLVGHPPISDDPSFDPPFPPPEYDRRRQLLRDRMNSAGLEALLLTEPADIYYLTGYDTQGYWNFQALLFPFDGPPALVCFMEEVGHALARGLEPASYLFGADPLVATRRLIEDRGLERARIGLDLRSRYLSVADHQRLRSALPAATFCDLDRVLEHLRLVKSVAELDYLRQAQTISNAAMAAALDVLRVGVSDRVVAMTFSAECIARGSDYFTQSPYVRFGPSMVEGHLTWQGRRLADGDAFELEVAAVRRRYTAPVVRFGVAGRLTGDLATAAAVSRAGLAAALDCARPGVRGADVRKVAQQAAIGRDVTYLPGGYSVGVGYPPDWTEADVVAVDSDIVLRAGMVIHMVSFCLLPSARIGTGEVIVVTTDGCEPLQPMAWGPMEVMEGIS